MKQLFIVLIILFGNLVSKAQGSKEYKFTTPEGDSIRNFVVNFPDDWYITNETAGSPYSIIAVKASAQQTLQLNKCSPEMRMGIVIYQNNLEETILKLGLQKKDNNFYLYKDVDDYVNIVVLADMNLENIKGVSFIFNKFTDCASATDGKKMKKNVRHTIKKQYIIFSYQNTTVCMESFNGEFGDAAYELVKKSFKINI